MARQLQIALTGDIDDGLEDIASCLRPLCETLNSCSVPMSIPVVAQALESSPHKMSFLAEQGIEIAGHGDVHEPFVGPVEVQRARLKAMRVAFEKTLGMSPIGFRAPYLAHDQNLYSALSLEGFTYDSSRTSHDFWLRTWNLFSRRRTSFRDTFLTYPRTLIREVSGRASAHPYPVAPRVVELPVFELDDWFFFEYAKGPKLDNSELDIVTDTWMKAARHLNGRDRLLVIQAHPKRISPTRLRVLEEFVAQAKREGYKFATLGELAQYYERLAV
ncbi:MAG TPA: polysaccharide deacetylase family protein [Thermoplasmata archaeon]